MYGYDQNATPGHGRHHAGEQDAYQQQAGHAGQQAGQHGQQYAARHAQHARHAGGQQEHAGQQQYAGQQYPGQGQYAGQQYANQQQYAGQQYAGQGQYAQQYVDPYATPGYEEQPPPPYGQEPLYPEPSPPTLTDAVRGFTTGAMGGEEFQGIFSASKVYCPRGDSPGFLALHDTQQPVIPMFSTLKELRQYAGKESKYFTITGAEVLDLLPSGYGFVLDMEGEHRVVFDAKAVEEMVDYAMRRMYG